MKKERQINKISSLLLFLLIFGSILLFSVPNINNIRGGILEDEIVDDSDKFSRSLKLGTEVTAFGTHKIELTYPLDAMKTTPTLGADGISSIVVYTSQTFDAINDLLEPGVIYAQRLSNEAAIPPLMTVAAGYTDNQLNDISGSYVVYTAFTDASKLQGQIQLIDLNNGHIPYVLSDQAMVREARINGDLVAWIEFFNGKSRVMLKDMAIGTAPMLISNEDTQPASSLQIGETFVVWEVKVVNDDDYNIVVYDLRTNGQHIWVTTNPTLHERYPSTSGTWVTWEEQVSPTVWRICAVDVDSGDVPIVVTDNGRYPTIDGDIIAYEALIDDGVNGLNYDIFIYRISTGETFAITTEVGDQKLNNLFGNQVAYVDSGDISVTTFWFDSCNLPPEITSINGPLDPVALGTTYEMTGTFTDPDDSGTHTATWDWGDGTTSSGVVELDNIVTGSHDYDTPGVYTITLTVVDSSGESDIATWSQFSVIYDPSTGFVTGGGWINSPEGAYLPNLELSGKANFGFIAKYKKGATLPTGNTVFQFHAGNLNFHSDTYDWLVIAGARGIFKGSGTINGEGSYKFMLTAVDGAINGGGGVDKFRIKIWVEDEESGEELIIYDNMVGAEDDAELDGTTEIGGGSIKIHK